MMVTGLDGRQYRWKLKSGNNSSSSNLHKQAHSVLRELFPCDRILEEVMLPGSSRGGYNGLRADLYIHARRLLVEVHGEQHYKNNGYFFSNKIAFLKAQQNDRAKMEWCELNEILYVELPYNMVDKWQTMITDALKES